MKFEPIRLCVGFEQMPLSMGAKVPVAVDFSSTHHLLIAAPSGIGKTYLLLLLL